jgi:hypothetical protein
MHSNSDKRTAATLNLISSGLAGAVALAICYPLDMARTRQGGHNLNARSYTIIIFAMFIHLRLAADVGSGSSRLYSGLSNCIYTVYNLVRID